MNLRKRAQRYCDHKDDLCIQRKISQFRREEKEATKKKETTNTSPFNTTEKKEATNTSPFNTLGFGMILTAVLFSR